ncbi:MAG: hypothetical protein ACOCXA_02235, partial [Planctomycetota bacterium]
MAVSSAEFEALTRPAVLAALREHADMDSRAFALRFGGRSEWPVRAMAEQLDCRRRAADKLSGWPIADMLFDKQGIEQCSHGLVARWRAGLMAGRRLWDVCGGLGIDAWAACTAGCAVTHCELDPDRARLAAWNHRHLHIDHVPG